MATTTMIQFALERGERLLWSGAPRQGLLFRPSDIVMVPFSLLWGGFAIFWETMVLRSKAPIFMAFFGIPFVVIGLYLIAGRFFVDAIARRRTFYGVTTDRIIITTGLLTSNTLSLELATLGGLSLVERADGTGTIGFGPAATMLSGSPAWTDTNRRMTIWTGGSAALGGLPVFDMIPDARSVHQIIQRAQQDARSAAAPKPTA